MNPARLASLPSCAVAFDTETHRVQDGLAAPPLVCGSIAMPLQAGPPARGLLLDREQTRVEFAHLIKLPDIVLVGANLPYDLIVMAHDAAQRGIDLMPAIFTLLAEGRAYDIQLAEGLNAIADGMLGKDPRTGAPIVNPETGRRGRYSLSFVTSVVLGRDNAKANDRFRESYALLEGIPTAQWPPDASAYPIDDAVNTLEAALAQAGHLPRSAEHEWRPIPGTMLLGCAHCPQQLDASQFGAIPPCPPRRRAHRNLHDLSVQVFKAVALALGGAWGVRTDPVATEALFDAAQEGRIAAVEEFSQVGFLRADDGTEDTAVVKRAVAIAYGCTGVCAACGGAGKVFNKFSKRDPNKPVGKPVQCKPCSATGLDLSTAPVPRTEPSTTWPEGQVQTGRDILVESGDEQLMEYAASQEDDKILDTYVPFLRLGYDAPITLSPNALLETGRVSYNGVIQLLPRQISARLAAKLKARGAFVIGVRDCVVAREGWVYYSNDYSGGELVTFAESAVNRVGFSDMGRALNDGADVHSQLGASMLGVPYSDFVHRLKVQKDKLTKAFRQAAKPANFGFPGGMGAPRLVLQQRASGPDTEWPDGPSMVSDGRGGFVPGYKGLRFCVLVGAAQRCGAGKVTEWKDRPCPPTCKACIEVAEGLRAKWFQTWSEARPYLDWHSQNVDARGEIEQHYSRRIRGGVDFCSEANGDFQALLADIAGRAQIRVSYEQYVDRSSVLYGSRSIVFAHDELFGEAREDVAAEVSERVNEIMVEEFRKGCPHHAAACKAEPTLMRRWYKSAEPRRDESGRLVCWTP